MFERVVSSRLLFRAQPDRYTEKATANRPHTRRQEQKSRAAAEGRDSGRMHIRTRRRLHCRSMKRVVVTGANKGIGLAIVEGILERADDALVFLGSRDRDRGESARASIVDKNADWARRVAVVALDVSDDASVAAAAKAVTDDIAGDAAPFYGVVNNAGIGLGNEGLERILEVNAVGMQRVCEAFVPLLDPQGGRVVNITSASGPNFVSGCNEARTAFLTNPDVTWADLQAFMQECLDLDGSEAFGEAGLGGGNAYGLSKAVANAYTLALARENPGLRVNACTPGFIETDLTRGYTVASGRSPQDMGMKPPREGAKAPLHLLLGELDGNGRYYGSDAERSPLHRYRSPGDPPYDGGE